MPRKKTKKAEGESEKNTEECVEKVKIEDESDETADEKLEKELNWCIDQLRIGLTSQKPTQEQVRRSVKMMKTLSSKSAPLVKKRQIMRQTFGDYRKKISEEEKRWAKDAEKLRKNATVQSGSFSEKGVFLRSSKRNCSGSQTFDGLSASEAAEEQCEVKDNLAQGCGFKFNFAIPDS